MAVLAIFRIRRDEAADWASVNPVLALGEPGLETDTRKVKYGDGSTPWNSLGYSIAAVEWGDITGTLSDQTDLNTALGLKAPLASPTFTGTPAGPTAAPGTNTTQFATTAFVTAGLALKANIASPSFTGSTMLLNNTAGSASLLLRATAGVTTTLTSDASGNLIVSPVAGLYLDPASTLFIRAASAAYATILSLSQAGNLTIPGVLTAGSIAGTTVGTTQSPGDNTTKLATTAFVTAAVSAGGGGAFRGALLYNSANITGLNLTTAIPIPFNSADRDTDNIHPLAATVTITIATPGVITWTGHNFLAGSPIVLTTTGALPTGLTAGTTYYVVNPAANTFQLAATPGGSAINTTGSQSGTHTGTNYSRLTVPSGVTKVKLKGQLELAGLTANVWMVVTIRKNGTTGFPGFPGQLDVTNTSFPVVQVTSPVLSVVGGDYFELFGQVQTDTNVDVQAAASWAEMEIVG